MSKPRFPDHRDRLIAPDTHPARSGSGDANALWRYEKQRRHNLLAKPGLHTVALVLDGLRADFNVAKIFRSAEVMGAHTIHLIDIGPFDPAPGKGAFKHVPARFHADFQSCRNMLQADAFTLVALEPHAAACIGDTALPKRCAFVLGNEATGLGEAARQATGLRRVRLPQWGQTESMNVAVAASLAMYEYTRQHGLPVPAPVPR